MPLELNSSEFKSTQVRTEPLSKEEAYSAGVRSKGRSLISDRSITVAILTGGGDRPYALGLASSLVAQGIAIEFLGSDEVHGGELRQNALVRTLNLRGDQNPNAPVLSKVLRVLVYYGRLLRYAASAKPEIFHILWNNKVELFDRTLLLIYYRCLGKRIAFTAHNVNARVRDRNDTFLNRLTLYIQYQLVHHIFVHTLKMRQELQTDFGVSASRISVIPFGLNSTVPNTELTGLAARRLLGLTKEQKVLLFFGNIAPYKGLEYLIDALALLAKSDSKYRLVIAGRPKGDSAYWQRIHNTIYENDLVSNVIERIEYVPDVETEIYFKAADVVVLPYTHIFQSGVLFLGYNFGLPAIATDIGSLRDDVIEGETGFICKPCDVIDLRNCIRKYFSSPLYLDLDSRRREIRNFARERYSWTKVGEITRSVYQLLLSGNLIS